VAAGVTRKNDRSGRPRDARGAAGLQPFARPFVAVLLAGFAVCGLFGVEAWPFSGFRLFSAPRPTTWSSFHGDVVGPDGEVSRLRVAALPAAFRAFGLVAARLPSRSEADRLATCLVYADAAETAGVRVEELRIYRVDHEVLPRDGAQPTGPVSSTLIARCRPSDVP
jgi:hypothetical protein